MQVESSAHDATAARVPGGWRARARSSSRLKLLGVYVAIAAAAVWIATRFGLDVHFIREWLPYIIKGVPLTLLISVAAIALAIPLALFGALGRLSTNALFNAPANFYVSFVRGTPLIVQIFFIYFGLPQLALAPGSPPWLQKVLILNIVTAGILALGINYGAYMTEIFRAGIQSVGHGQLEAAHALGMSGRQTMRRIVLPQAIRVIIPPCGNEFIAMLKDSALVGLAGTQELFFRASTIGRQTAHGFETFAVAAVIYWIMTSIFSFFQVRLERRMARGFVREGGHAH